MTKHPKIAVFASGSGSNFEALMEKETLAEHIGLLVCDKPDARVIERAEASRVPTLVFAPWDFKTKAAYEAEIVRHLREYGISYIVLAGYMRLIGPMLLQPFAGKIINIHPSLLPAFPGLDAIGQAIRAGARETGVTIHYVDAGMDTGPIIKQKNVPIYHDDTEETLQARLQKVEHTLYPETIEALIKQ